MKAEGGEQGASGAACFVRVGTTLERVKEKQARQESQLEDIGLILPLLFPEAERKHLLNLESGKTTDYKGDHALGVELRRLRSAGLIGIRPNQHISELKDGSAFDPANLYRTDATGTTLG